MDLKEIVSEDLICPACGKAGEYLKLVLKRKSEIWFIFECQTCKTEFKALTLPDSRFWVIFPPEKKD